MKYANLHLHSVYSDGILTPRELCEKAAQKGYKAIALTDHETTAGTAEMRAAAAEFRLEFINGIECCVRHKDISSYHMVGLGFDPEHPRMRAYTRQCAEIAAENTRRHVDFLAENGAYGDISWEEVTARFPDVEWYCNEHVFKVLQEKQNIPDTDYWQYNALYNGAPLGKPFTLVEAAEMIDIIRAAGGIAIIAHPSVEQLRDLPELAALGLGGVETDHPSMIPEAVREATRLAAELGICASGGSDHYGILGNSTRRGPKPGRIYPTVPEHLDTSNGASREEYERIRERVR